MKIVLISVFTGLVLSACASPRPVVVPPESTVTLATPVQRVYPSILDMQGEFDPGATFGVFRTEPMLERMPGGDLYDIPGGLGRYRRLTPAQKVAHDDARQPPTITVPSRGEALITPDRLDWDIHTLMHYLALYTDLQIIVEGDVDQRVHAVFSISDELTRGKAVEVIQSVCKACKLDFIQDGVVIIVKARPEETSLANVINGDWAGVYHVKFEEQDLVTAIMEVAVVTKSQVLVPTSGTDKTQESKGGGIKQVHVTLELKNATAEEVLRKLAELGDMDLEVEKDEGGQPVYRFSYKE